MHGRLKKAQEVLAGAGLLLLLATTGCGAFFQCEGKADCGTGTTTGSITGNFVYVTNVSNNVNAISGYNIASGTLAALPSSPYALNIQPVALAVSKNNAFLYAATTNGGIYIYSLASTGVPSAANSGTPVNDGHPISAMILSPDGNYLFTIENQSTSFVLQEYTLPSSGIPAPAAVASLPSAANCTTAGTPPQSLSAAPCSIAVSPSEQYVIATAGTSGDILYPYSSTSGITNTTSPMVISSLSGSSELQVAVDASNYAYILQTSTISTYSVSSSGSPTSTVVPAYTFPAPATPPSQAPRSIVATNGFLYTGDEGTSTLSQFSASNGVLASVASDLAGPTNVSAIGVDSTGKYVVAAGFGSTVGVELFSISSTGALTTLNQFAPTGTTTSVPVAIAFTH